MSNRFNHHMQSHFSSCVCLAHTRDECRDRQVKVYALPGEFELVGVSDGTDAWIAPVAADPFSVNIKRLLEDHAAGKSSRPRRRPPDDTPTPEATPTTTASAPGRVRRVPASL